MRAHHINRRSLTLSRRPSSTSRSWPSGRSTRCR